jgi:hypothetical protein
MEKAPDPEIVNAQLRHIIDRDVIREIKARFGVRQIVMWSVGQTAIHSHSFPQKVV